MNNSSLNKKNSIIIIAFSLYVKNECKNLLSKKQRSDFN